MSFNSALVDGLSLQGCVIEIYRFQILIRNE